jgi:uncharacterized lipoprotein YajG
MTAVRLVVTSWLWLALALALLAGCQSYQPPGEEIWRAL